MYVHHGCRCDACCKVEHEQYLKRAGERNRTNSKWGEKVSESTTRAMRQKKYNKDRYVQYKKTASYKNRIRWQDLAEKFGMRCALCGKETNPHDTWTENGRVCFGRDYPTVDHIVSLKNGGEDTEANVQLLCKRCNSMKGAS